MNHKFHVIVLLEKTQFCCIIIRLWKKIVIITEMAYFITKKKQNKMLEVLFEHRDATLRKRDKHKKKKDYYDSLLDLLHDLEEVQESNLVKSKRYPTYCGLRTKYNDHKQKFKALDSRYYYLQANIDLLLSYPVRDQTL